MKVFLCFVLICVFPTTMAVSSMSFKQLAALVLQLQAQQKLLEATILTTAEPNTLSAATQESVVATQSATNQLKVTPPAITEPVPTQRVVTKQIPTLTTLKSILQSSTNAPVTQSATNAQVTQSTANAPVTQPTTSAPITLSATQAAVTQSATQAAVTQSATKAPVTQPASNVSRVTQDAINTSQPTTTESNAATTTNSSTQSSSTTTALPLTTTLNPSVVANMKLNALDILAPSVTSALEAQQKQIEMRIQALGEEASRLASEGRNIGGAAGDAMLKRAEELRIQEENTILAAEILLELTVDMQEFFVDVQTQRKEMADLLPTTTPPPSTSVTV